MALRRTLALSLEAQPDDAPMLAGAVALALAVIELNRPALTAAAAVTYAGDDYGAASRVKRLRLVGVTAPASTTRLMTLEADMTLTLERSLRPSEGKPIRQITSPGRTGRPSRTVDIEIGVGA